MYIFWYCGGLLDSIILEQNNGWMDAENAGSGHVSGQEGAQKREISRWNASKSIVVCQRISLLDVCSLVDMGGCTHRLEPSSFEQKRTHVHPSSFRV